MGSHARPPLPIMEKLKGLKDRCDFQGLLHRGFSSTTHQGRVIYDFSASESILHKLAKMKDQVDSVYTSVWHHVLQLYGQGESTATIFIKKNHGKLFVLNHQDVADTKFSKIRTDMIENSAMVPLPEVVEYADLIDSFLTTSMEFDSLENSLKAFGLHTPNLAGFIQISNSSNKIRLHLTANPQLFDSSILHDMASVFFFILEQSISNPDLSPNQAELIPDSQLDQIIQWNSTTDGDFPKDKRLHHLFEEAVARTPNRIAISCNDAIFTYQELNGMACKLANYLINVISIEKEEFILLFLEKTELTLASILGVWKSGAAHVPIDPRYPDDRVAFTLRDTNAKYILSNKKYSDRLNKIFGTESVKILLIEDILCNPSVSSAEIPNNLRNLKSTDLAYVTYTSGTTGVPKGVYKEHRGVVNSITDLTQKYEMSYDQERQENVLLFSAYVFEPFIRQSLIALVNSHKLVIIQEDDKMDPVRFINFLKKNEVTYLNGTASVLQEFDFSSVPSLQKVMLVGEEMTPSRYKKLREILPNRRLINEYGFTESALVTAIKVFNPLDARTDRSIGRPLRNVKMYVLGNNMRRVPIGVIGNLFVGGEGISRGYMNRDSLTKERFVKNPFGPGFIYMTGDLARWLPSGEVEYIGRNDFQIKLRGIRIEPGEIEAVLCSYPGDMIDSALVLMKEPKGQEEKQLVGYYVLKRIESNAEVTEGRLFQHLEKTLPRYMIPVRLIQVDKIPTTINGKADWRTMPEYDVDAVDHEFDFPVEESEMRLEQIWKDILNFRGRIGRNENFFRLGGHSISCIQLIGRIRQTFTGAVVTVDDIFRLKTIAELAKLIMKETREPSFAHIVPKVIDTTDIENAENIEGLALANSLQQGLFYHHLKQGLKDDAYIMQSVFKYHLLDKDNAIEDFPKLLHCSWKMAQEQFQALRLRFAKTKEGVIQIVDRKQEFIWRYQEIHNVNEVKKHQQRERKEGFNLEQGRLIRIHLLKDMSQRGSFFLIFNCHHIILDGWSYPILFAFVHSAFEKLGNKAALPSLNLESTSTYLNVQRYLQHHKHDWIDYWVGETSSLEERERADLSSLIKEDKRYKVQLSDYNLVQEMGEESIYFHLNVTALHENEITVHTLLQYAWHKILSLYGNSNVTVSGTTISGRNIPVDGIENCVGFFINTLPLIVHHDDYDKTILEEIKSIQEKVNLMNSRSMVELSQIQKGRLKQSLFDCIFVLENYPQPQSDNKMLNEKLGFELFYEVEKLDYPIAVIAKETGNGKISFTISYAAELFERQTIQTLLKMVEHFCDMAIKNLPYCLKNLELILPKEMEILEEWNSKSKETFQGDSLTLHELFERHAEASPDRVALVYEENKYIYREMNRSCNKFAKYLMAFLPSLQNDDMIALLLDKNEFMIFSIFSIWKAGAAYVPIDPSYPTERIKFILSDTKAKAIITNLKHVNKAHAACEAPVPVLPIEEIFVSETVHKLSPENLKLPYNHRSLAYVIYTSGTSGNPKGVMVEHVGVVNLVKSLSEIFSLNTRTEVIFSFSNYVFDHFVEQMTDALLNGQTLLLLPDWMRANKDKLHEYMTQNNVTYLSGTPSVLSLYEYKNLPSLARIDGVGEDFTTALFNKIRSTFENPEGIVINGYGPTEISITSHKKLYKQGDYRVDKSIGHQVHNTESYVLHPETLQRVPIGCCGELCIGGIGVVRGYLNRPDLTRERFLKNPFSKGNMYRTGDIVRFLPNGEVEYLGRQDFQVKVNGLRIELGEVEAALLKCEGVSQAVATTVKEDVDGRSVVRIVGYVVCRNLNEADVIEELEGLLPSYMVPSRILEIPEIPVTLSGKVDLKGLPKVSFLGPEEAKATPPETEAESKMCKIWGKVLGVAAEDIGVIEDFFRVGGDSLTAISLSFLISSEWKKTFTVADVFKTRTIRKMMTKLETGEPSQMSTSNQRAKVIAPLSPQQEKLLYLHEIGKGTSSCSAFNIFFALRIKGNYTVNDITRSLLSILDRHEILRTTYNFENHQQIVIPFTKAKNHFESFCIQNFTQGHGPYLLEMEMKKMYREPFNLNESLPWRAAIFRDEANNDIVLSLVFHHICFDGWSFGVFKKELANFLQNPKKELPPLPIQYWEYSAEHGSDGESGQRLPEADYQLSLAKTDYCRLFTDYATPAKFNHESSSLSFSFNKKFIRNLGLAASNLETTTFCILSSALLMTIKTFSVPSKDENNTNVVIGFPTSNRAKVRNTKDLIGFFVEVLPLTVNISLKQTFEEFFKTVQEEISNATPTKQPPEFQVVFSHEIERSNKNSILEEFKTNSEIDTLTKYELTLFTKETRNGSLEGKFTFASSLFKETTIVAIKNCFISILEGIVEKGSSNLALTDLIRFQSKDIFPKPTFVSLTKLHENQGLMDAFDSVVRNYGNEIAVRFKERSLTFKQLDKQANCVADYLLDVIKNNVENLSASPFVALLLEKSETMIASILAVWKLGLAYVPIDPTLPKRRIQHILTDTQTSVILTSRKFSTLLSSLENNMKHIFVEAVEFNRNPPNPLLNPLNQCFKKNHIAYCIYTSGSTGKPKGVTVNKQSLTKFQQSLIKEYNFERNGKKEVLLMLSNYSFDFSLEQIMLSIFAGNELLICREDEIFSLEFYQFLNKHRLTYLSGTPSVLSQLDFEKLPDLKSITLAGEKLTEGVYKKIRSSFRKTIRDAYGTTETCVYNIVKSYYPDPDAIYTGTFDKCIGDCKIFLLNEAHREVPLGGIGEICISGDCLAEGYLNLEELTNTKFIFFNGQRLYKTGDLGRKDPESGQLQVLGRIDTQIKLRGFRIELEGVKNSILNINGIDNTHVFLSTIGKDHLVTFCTGNDSIISSTCLRQKLQDTLPTCMIPEKFVQVAQLPVTSTGKIDQKEMERQYAIMLSAENQLQEKPSLESTSTLEERICSIFSTVLNLKNESVAKDDDFFLSGGDSLSSLRLTAQLRTEFKHTKISLKDVFTLRTPRLIAQRIHDDSLRSEDVKKISGGLHPLLPIQQWFFSKKLIKQNQWNLAFTIETDTEVDFSTLETSWKKLAKVHPELFLRFKKGFGTKTVQFYGENSTTLMECTNLSKINDEVELEEHLIKLQERFDLENGPLATACLIHQNKVWICLHHLISDVVSMEILTRDLQTLYKEKNTIGSSDNANYIDWVHYARSQFFFTIEEKEYWEELLAGISPFNEKLSKHSTNDRSLTRHKFCIKKHWRNISSNSVVARILSALVTALRFALAEREIFITMEGHGRIGTSSLDITNTLGWFTTMYPLAVSCSNGGTADEISTLLQENPNNGIGFGLLYGYSLLPRITFNFLGDVGTKSGFQSGWKIESIDFSSSRVLRSEETRSEASSLLDVTSYISDEGLFFEIDSYLDSLTVKKIMQALQERMQTHTSSENFLQQPCKDLYYVFNETLAETIFLFPPAEGGAECYMNNLIPKLNRKRVIAFNNLYRDFPDKFANFEELAQEYVSAIKVLTHGNLNEIVLCGWSFGGVLAFEIARQLPSLKFKKLVLVDPYFDVRYATECIGLTESNIVGSINYSYNPKVANSDEYNCRETFMLKATMLNDMHRNANQLALFEHYKGTESNHLDRLLNPTQFQIIRMEGETHSSWISNEDVLNMIAKILE